LYINDGMLLPSQEKVWFPKLVFSAMNISYKNILIQQYFSWCFAWTNDIYILIIWPTLDIYCRGRHGCERMATDLSQVTDKLYHITPWSRFELTTSVVICTDCIGSCKSNYHTIMATTAPYVCTYNVISFLSKFFFFHFLKKSICNSTCKFVYTCTCKQEEEIHKCTCKQVLEVFCKVIYNCKLISECFSVYCMYQCFYSEFWCYILILMFVYKCTCFCYEQNHDYTKYKP
jgi:hypothetical protein